VLTPGRSCSEAFLSAETCTSRGSRNATAHKFGKHFLHALVIQD
jgi:hypothetical protein